MKETSNLACASANVPIVRHEWLLGRINELLLLHWHLLILSRLHLRLHLLHVRNVIELLLLRRHSNHSHILLAIARHHCLIHRKILLGRSHRSHHNSRIRLVHAFVFVMILFFAQVSF